MPGKKLWADSYCCGTAGHVSQKQVIRYIAEQDKQVKNIQPFSYSIFDKEQTTLADFTTSVSAYISALEKRSLTRKTDNHLLKRRFGIVERGRNQFSITSILISNMKFHPEK
ncbi:MAG: transposase [Thermoplasmatales archaeon]|nr:transposase [Thermoplasmatales archaeon]